MNLSKKKKIKFRSLLKIPRYTSETSGSTHTRACASLAIHERRTPTVLGERITPPAELDLYEIRTHDNDDDSRLPTRRDLFYCVRAERTRVVIRVFAFSLSLRGRITALVRDEFFFQRFSFFLLTFFFISNVWSRRDISSCVVYSLPRENWSDLYLHIYLMHVYIAAAIFPESCPAVNYSNGLFANLLLARAIYLNLDPPGNSNFTGRNMYLRTHTDTHVYRSMHIYTAQERTAHGDLIPMTRRES